MSQLLSRNEEEEKSMSTRKLSTLFFLEYFFARDFTRFMANMTVRFWKRLAKFELILSMIQHFYNFLSV